MKKRILSLLLVVLMFVSAIPVASTYASDNADELSLWLVDDSGAEQPAEDVALYRGGAVRLAAHRGAAVSGGLQWQIASGDEWINIQGATADTLRVSYGMVAPLLADGAARLRCMAGECESKAVSIRVTDEGGVANDADEPAIAPEPLPAPVATVVDSEPAPEPQSEPKPEPKAMPESETGEAGIALMALADEPQETPLGTLLPGVAEEYHTVKIEYLYAPGTDLENQTVAQLYIGEFFANSEKVTVNSPNRIGYEPDADHKTITIDPAALTGDETITVYYYPAVVSYTVRHYQQNVADDEYTLVETELKSGYTEKATEDDIVAKSYEGFYALAHYPEKIAANSSTVIDVYYDREYYMITFDLDGGSGVEPVYARYGASISVGQPIKAGYVFGGWMTGAATETLDLPATMPVGGGQYTAKWTVGDNVPFTVVYWLQNPNDPDEYDYRLAWTDTAPAGSEIDVTKYQNFQDHFAQSELDPYAVKYSYYDHYDGDTTVKGDGSSVLNVYYKRREFTLKFYYAISTGSDENEKYYVVGGSTYYFGRNAGISNANKGNEIRLLDQYVTTYSSLTGQVKTAPALNAKGAERGYTTGSDKSTVNNTEYQYHYIAFKARYGQDISELWPRDVFDYVENVRASNTGNNWKGTKSVVSAWNGEHHVYYSRNGNQTIKGKYSELDYQLLWEENYGTPDDNTVSYLCFWENGADVYWSIPRLRRYQIWVQAYDGEKIGKRETKTKDGATYYLLDSYDTCDDSVLAGQTQPAINGFTAYGANDQDDLDNPDNTVYESAIAVNFYYTRNQYELTFKNGENTIATQMVYYGQDITGLAPGTEGLEHYDEGKRDGGYLFSYWGTSPDGIKSKSLQDVGKMPNSKLTLYANWTTVQQTVRVYQDESLAYQLGEDITVAHDALVPQTSWPQDPEMGQDDQMEFLGWFYKDSKGEEHAFAFASTPVTEDLNVYAKWRSHVMKRVTIKYCVETESGALTEEEVAPEETLMLRVGQTRTFDAKTGSQLYSDYQTGCFPTTASHSITLTADSEEQTSYTFAYRKNVTVPYTVRFMVRGEDGSTRPAFTVDATGKAVFMDEDSYSATAQEYKETHDDNQVAIVAENYVPENLADLKWTLPNEYLPNALYIQKVIEYGKDNTITFYYDHTPGAESKARYTVIHYVENAAQSGATPYVEKEMYDLVGTVGSTVTAGPIAINGYEFDETATRDHLGTNSYADGKVAGTVVNGHTLTLALYYKAKEYPYRVLYLDKDTEQELLPEKTMADGKLLTAKFGQTVTESAPTIKDYAVEGSGTKSIVIQQEASTDKANLNTIIFYYKKQSAALRITKQVTLDAEQAEKEGYTGTDLPASALEQMFTFTVFYKNGLPKNLYDYTVEEAGKDPISGKAQVQPGGQTLVVSIRSGQSVTIHDLPLGDYTVTEQNVTGFLTVVGDEICADAKATLDAEGETETVAFENCYPFYTGDLVVRKALPSGAHITGSYKVHVTLWPEKEARSVERVVKAEGSETVLCTVPAWDDDGTNAEQFAFDILVPAGASDAPGTVALKDVPAGRIKVEEISRDAARGTIDDYYTVYYRYVLHRSNDDSYRLGSAIEGELHGGHPTAVTFGNVPKTGDMTIEKTVTQEYANDSFESDTFAFTVTGYSELPAGEYSVNDGQYTATVDASGNVTLDKAVSITVTKAENQTEWANSAALAGLPAGHYTVTETEKEGYTCQQTDAKVSGLQVGGESAPKAAFVNEFKRTSGDLTVSKTIELTKQDEGVSIDREQAFEFTLLLTDGALRGPYQTADGKTLTVQTDANGQAYLTFMLKHDEAITIKGLPVGQYELREKSVAHYESSFAKDADDPSYCATEVTVASGTAAEVACVNRYPVDTATLVVKKQVVTPEDYSTIDQAPAGDRFQFTVTLSGYSDSVVPQDFIRYTFYGADGRALSAGDYQTPTYAAVESGYAVSFALLNGQYVEFTMPVCAFTVAETGVTSTAHPDDALADHYTTACVVKGTDGEPTEGEYTAARQYSLAAGASVSAEFTNTYKRHYADLTIVTQANYADQNFIFDVASEDGSIRLQVILGSTDRRTIKDLPVGKYTVTEQNDWSWREAAVAPQETTPFDLSTGSKTATFAYGDAERTKWLSGYSCDIGKEG